MIASSLIYVEICRMDARHLNVSAKSYKIVLINVFSEGNEILIFPEERMYFEHHV